MDFFARLMIIRVQICSDCLITIEALNVFAGVCHATRNLTFLQRCLKL